MKDEENGRLKSIVFISVMLVIAGSIFVYILSQSDDGEIMLPGDNSSVELDEGDLV